MSNVSAEGNVDTDPYRPVVRIESAFRERSRMKTVSKFLLWGSALLATHAYPAAPMISDAGNAAITNFARKATERGDVPGRVTLIVNRANCEGQQEDRARTSVVAGSRNQVDIQRKHTGTRPACRRDLRSEARRLLSHADIRTLESGRYVVCRPRGQGVPRGNRSPKNGRQADGTAEYAYARVSGQRRRRALLHRERLWTVPAHAAQRWHLERREDIEREVGANDGSKSDRRDRDSDTAGCEPYPNEAVSSGRRTRQVRTRISDYRSRPKVCAVP